MDQADEEAFREWPDVDDGSGLITSRLFRIAQLLEEAHRAELEPFAIRQSEADVLGALRRAGAPYELSPTDIVRSLLRSSSAMSNRIDRLESRGFVERRADPNDRRRIIVRLTPEGFSVIDDAFPAVIKRLRCLLFDLSDSDRAEFVRLLKEADKSIARASRLRRAVRPRRLGDGG